MNIERPTSNVEWEKMKKQSSKKPALLNDIFQERNRYGLEKMGMTGLGRSYKAKPLNCDPRNAGVFSIKINQGSHKHDR